MQPGFVQVFIRLLISITGIIENLFVIIVFIMYPKLVRNVSMKVILNVAITDLINALVYTMRILTVAVAAKGWSFVCLGQWLVIMCMTLVSQSVLCIATLDRYISICHQERYVRIMTTKTLASMIVTSWIIPLALSLIPFFGFYYPDAENRCFYPNLLHEWVYRVYSVVNIVLINVTLILYIRILLKAKAFYRRFYPAQVAVLNEASMRLRAKQKSIKSSKAMGIITTFFIACWLPFHILQMWFGLGYNDDGSIFIIFGALGAFNSLINPFLFVWQKQDFRTEALKILKCKFLQKTESFDIPHSRPQRFRQPKNNQIVPADNADVIHLQKKNTAKPEGALIPRERSNQDEVKESMTLFKDSKESTSKTASVHAHIMSDSSKTNLNEMTIEIQSISQESISSIHENKL